MGEINLWVIQDRIYDRFWVEVGLSGRKWEVIKTGLDDKKLGKALKGLV